jgi:PPOX class probable F420-dependent enzyme
MDAEAAREFLRRNFRGVLVTTRRDGRPQTSPVTATVDGAGDIVISSRETAYKVRNLRRAPRATYCGFTDRFFGPWVQVDGAVTVQSLPEAMEPLVDYYRRISGEHENWDEYRKAMVDQRRVIIRISVDQVGPTVTG